MTFFVPIFTKVTRAQQYFQSSGIEFDTQSENIYEKYRQKFIKTP